MAEKLGPILTGKRSGGASGFDGAEKEVVEEGGLIVMGKSSVRYYVFGIDIELSGCESGFDSDGKEEGLEERVRLCPGAEW